MAPTGVASTTRSAPPIASASVGADAIGQAQLDHAFAHRGIDVRHDDLAGRVPVARRAGQRGPDQATADDRHSPIDRHARLLGPDGDTRRA